MSHEDLLQQVKEQYVQGQTSTPLIVIPVSEEEQSANAELTRQKALTEKENRMLCIMKRFAIGGAIGFLLGLSLGILVTRI